MTKMIREKNEQVPEIDLILDIMKIQAFKKMKNV
jgi:hypothetical protein